MSLTVEQENAVKIMADRYLSNEKITVLQGPAGSGKTFLLNYFLNFIGQEKEKVAYAAFTGTAAKILMGQGLNASTIHKLIYNPIIRRGQCIGFRKKTREELRDLRLIIVDEFSMLPQNILEDLLSYNIPLILVGDQYQLPPIGQKNKFINQAHAVLTEPIRQALDNPVLWAANQARLKKRLPSGLHGNIVYIGYQYQLKEEWLRKDVKIIVGLNKTRNELNIKIAGSSLPQPGHKIIFLKNDWKNLITNGTLAEINSLQRVYFQNYKLHITTEEGIVHKMYMADFQEPSNPKKQFFDFGYALTCHKAQGATYDAPGLIIDESQFFKQDASKWLYTAISRFSGNYNLAILK